MALLVLGRFAGGCRVFDDEGGIVLFQEGEDVCAGHFFDTPAKGFGSRDDAFAYPNAGGGWVDGGDFGDFGGAEVFGECV